MSKVIRGTDVILDIYKIDDFYPFVCAENMTISFDMEPVSVKTIGDGKWKAYRGQSLGYTLNANGLIPYDDAVNVTAFDVLDRMFNMVHNQFRIVYRDQDSNVVKSQNGYGLITNTSFTGPMDFAGGSLAMLGSGPLVMFDGLTACDAAITGLTLNSQTDTSATFGYSGAVQADRFDYRIFAGLVSIYSGTVFAPALPGGTFTVTPIIANGLQTITVTPICGNGEPGTPITINFNKT